VPCPEAMGFTCITTGRSSGLESQILFLIEKCVPGLLYVKVCVICMDLGQVEKNLESIVNIL
jgi:hypothetical protein